MSHEPRRILLGTLDLAGEEMEFKAEAPSVFDAKVGETLELVVAYRYTEPSHDEDLTRIVLSAELGGMKLGSIEERIEDEKLLDDTKRSYFALPFRVERHGPQDLRFALRVVYTRKPWDNRSPGIQATLDEDGALRLRVA